MGKLIETLRQPFFLEKHKVSETTLQLLKDLYPRVDWSRVSFHEGLPWFTPAVAPYVTAQALPDFYSLGRYKIYIKKMDESRAQCLADIVHEGYHIMQAMEFWKGYGFGFFRGMMVYYNALFLKHGYRSNPFEVPAFDQEFRFLDYCQRHGLHGIISKVTPDALKYISNEKTLVFTHYPFKYEGNFFALAGSFFFCFLIALIRPVADVLVFIARFLVKKRPSSP